MTWVQFFFCLFFSPFITPSIFGTLTYAPNQICCQSIRFHSLPYSLKFAWERGFEPLQLRLFEQAWRLKHKIMLASLHAVGMCSKNRTNWRWLSLLLQPAFWRFTEYHTPTNGLIVHHILA